MRPNANENLEKGFFVHNSMLKRMGVRLRLWKGSMQKCLFISKKNDTGSSETFVSEAYMLIQVKEDTWEKFMTIKLI